MHWIEKPRMLKPAAAGTMEHDALQAWERNDYAEAIRLYEALANNGSEAAMIALAWLYLSDNETVRRSPEQARRWLEGALSIRWSVDASLMLGHLYYTGDGGPVDYSRAFQVYSPFEQGTNESAYFARGLFRLGVMYELGRGTKPNISKAMEMYRRAVKGGNIHARKNLAVLEIKQGHKIKGYLCWVRAVLEGWTLLLTTSSSARTLP